MGNLQDLRRHRYRHLCHERGQVHRLPGRAQGRRVVHHPRRFERSTCPDRGRHQGQVPRDGARTFRLDRNLSRPDQPQNQHRTCGHCATGRQQDQGQVEPATSAARHRHRRRQRRLCREGQDNDTAVGQRIMSGYFATAIGRHFFPHEDAVAQLLSAFGVFALGYLMRPVGGVVVGHIGDRLGRRAALTFSVAAMAIPTFLIGLLPGYATLGLLAPIALTLLRMMQGLSVGGEYTSSMVFLVEHAPDGRRGLMGALASSGAGGGTLLGSAVGAGFAASMSDATLAAWGWRIPFLLGLVVGIGGYFLRRHVLDTVPTERRKRAPIVETLHDHWPIVLGFAGLSVFNAVGFYVSFVYLVSWLQTADGIAPARAPGINPLRMAG